MKILSAAVLLLAPSFACAQAAPPPLPAPPIPRGFVQLGKFVPYTRVKRAN